MKAVSQADTGEAAHGVEAPYLVQSGMQIRFGVLAMLTALVERAVQQEVETVQPKAMVHVARLAAIVLYI